MSTKDFIKKSVMNAFVQYDAPKLAVALLAAIMTNPAVQRRDIEIFLSSLGPGKTARYIEEEMTWRLEY